MNGVIGQLEERSPPMQSQPGQAEVNMSRLHTRNERQTDTQRRDKVETALPTTDYW